ncbi:hypothetical protein FHW03_004376 [Ochrobactrum sp. RH2CCR150]|nr:hypothetical protein [Ochrobactrum sp. RH2CCR150]
MNSRSISLGHSRNQSASVLSWVITASGKVVGALGWFEQCYDLADGIL